MEMTMRVLPIILIIALYCLSACSNPKGPSNDDAKKYFSEQCISGLEIKSLSDFSKNTQINFELVSRSKKETEYDFYYRAEIKYLIDGYSSRKGERRYYEGIVSFWKDKKGWKPQSVTVYGQPCRR
ncbi:MAG: hypothetical protein WA126_07135 [Thermodesulfovibrionales bacterium]